MNENKISYEVIGAALRLHQALGPGLLEAVYETALAYDLTEMGFMVKSQVPIPFIYKEVKMNVGYRADILVEDKVIVEVKSVEFLLPVHMAQTLTYLRLANKKLALLINFNTPLLKDGIHRIVNKL